MTGPIVIAEGQKELKNDVRAMSDALKEFKGLLDQTNERQRDQDARLTHVTSMAVALQVDQRDDHGDIAKLQADHSRWKLYMKVALVLASPVYVIILALLIEYGKKTMFP